MLCHQCNTNRGTNKHGKYMSEAMFREYPEANCYKDGTNARHKPGTYQKRAVSKNGTKFVVNVFAQTHHAGRAESEPQKARYYEQALTKLAEEITGPCTVAIPRKGEGFQRAAKKFANLVRPKGVKVFLIKYEVKHGERDHKLTQI